MELEESLFAWPKDIGAGVSHRGLTLLPAMPASSARLFMTRTRHGCEDWPGALLHLSLFPPGTAGGSDRIPPAVMVLGFTPARVTGELPVATDNRSSVTARHLWHFATPPWQAATPPSCTVRSASRLTGPPAVHGKVPKLLAGIGIGQTAPRLFQARAFSGIRLAFLFRPRCRSPTEERDRPGFGLTTTGQNPRLRVGRMP